MAASSVAFNNFGRTAGFGTVCAIPMTVTATATAYATATGGLPVDIAPALLGVAGWPGGFVRPEDVVCIVAQSMSTNKFFPANLVIGTSTYTTIAGVTTQGGPINKLLATCPCTFRIWATGSGNAAAFAEIADGNLTDTYTFLLIAARGGVNV